MKGVKQTERGEEQREKKSRERRRTESEAGHKGIHKSREQNKGSK